MHKSSCTDSKFYRFPAVYTQSCHRIVKSWSYGFSDFMNFIHKFRISTSNQMQQKIQRPHMTYLFHGGNPSPCVHKLAHDTTLLELQDGKSFGRSCKSSSLFFFSPMSLAGLCTGQLSKLSLKRIIFLKFLF